MDGSIIPGTIRGRGADHRGVGGHRRGGDERGVPSLPPMAARGRGGVILLASTAAYQPCPYWATYGATKAFNLMLGEALWAELAPRGVEVLALSPGYTRTEFQQAANV